MILVGWVFLRSKVTLYRGRVGDLNFQEDQSAHSTSHCNVQTGWHPQHVFLVGVRESTCSWPESVRKTFYTRETTFTCRVPSKLPLQVEGTWP